MHTKNIFFFFFLFGHQCQYMCVPYAGITGTLMTRKFKYSKREPPSFALLVKNKANKLCNNEINTLQPNIGLDIQNWTFKMLKKKRLPHHQCWMWTPVEGLGQYKQISFCIDFWKSKSPFLSTNTKKSQHGPAKMKSHLSSHYVRTY